MSVSDATTVSLHGYPPTYTDGSGLKVVELRGKGGWKRECGLGKCAVRGEDDNEEEEK